MSTERVYVGAAGPSRIGRDQLISDLRALGVRPGQDLLIHCSMHNVGTVEGGARTLLQAIMAVAGPAATLVAPTQTTQNSLTSRAFLTATDGLSPAEKTRYIEAMPGFDPVSTPSEGMGVLAEQIRTHPAAVRSSHPQVSFAAIGSAAAACMAVHDLDCHLGERSPLGWLYAADAAILLLGVGYCACTALHLAEYRRPSPPTRWYHCFTRTGDARVRQEFTDIDLDDSDFGLLGAELDRTGIVRHGRVGAAACRLVSLRAAVDFSCGWLADHRRSGAL